MSQELLDRILAVYAEGDHAAEVRQARGDYFAQLTDLREDDPSFERLTQCFLYWYVVDRPMQGDAATPLQRFAAQDDLSQEDRQTCMALAASVHSLFEVLRLGDGGTQLKDLFTLEVLQVRERRQLAGLARGDLLEARLLPVADRLVFASGAFVHHPRAAGDAIRAAVERCRVRGEPSPADLLLRLQALTFRYTDRYRERVPVGKVFDDLQ